MSEKEEYVLSDREKSLCPCKSRQSYGECCRPYHKGKAKPSTAEQLMRSRYCAYFFREVDYLVETTHPDSKTWGLKRELATSVNKVNWSFLKIIGSSKGGKDDKTGKVEFVAEYFADGEQFEMQERSRFKRFKGNWKYLDDKG